MLDDGLGLVRITQFTEATVDETHAAVQSVLAGRPRGLILDLRSNGGGLLQPAVKVAGLFLGGGPVVLERHADGEEKTHAAPDGAALTALPMVVLVDRGTASAAEVVAAALRDRGRAALLGERTYGKSTVQYIHRLSDGSGLRLTVAEWHTPSGQLIPPTGLTPDVAAAAPNALPAEGDPVLKIAEQQLLTVVASQPTSTTR
jgi:carboxyl-terminal processing protease